MIYEEPRPITFEEAEAHIASNDPFLIADALVRASRSDVDPKWVETASLQSLEHPDVRVQLDALLALMNLARRYKSLDLEVVMRKIEPLRENPLLSGKVEDLLDDIDVFMR